jgi:hypothetical protein
VLFIATCQDRTQRAELRAAALPRRRMPQGLSACLRMQRKLRTKRGRTTCAQRGASLEPVIGQMKDRQGAGQFSMRGFRCVPAGVACACRRTHAGQRAPGVCSVPRGRRSDERQAGEQGLTCQRKGRLRPLQLQMTLPSALPRSLRASLYNVLQRSRTRSKQAEVAV